MAEDQGQEKTEEATPKKRMDARNQGQVAKSQEINSVAILVTGLLVISLSFPYFIENAADLIRAFFAMIAAGPATVDYLDGLFPTVIKHFFRIVSPMLLGTAVIALVTGFAQVGFHISPSVLEPKLSKLNPLEGAKRIMGKRAMMEFGKGIFKLVVIMGIGYLTYKSRLTEIVNLMFASPQSLVPESMKIATVFLIRALTALAAMAVIDYVFQKYELNKTIRMSVQDLKQEMKESEGDPLLKGRMRAIQQKLSQARMMDSVKDAALIITNPTHYAIALAYDETEDPAPRVLAKGKNHIAQKIKELGREHNVPIVEKRTLARMLYKDCEIGQVIPTTLFEAVAEVLAYILSLKKKVGR